MRNGLCRSHHAQNRQQMDVEGNGMVAKEFQDKLRQAERESGGETKLCIRRCKTHYTNIRHRKVEGAGKRFCPVVD